jgi:tungstate transport system substrate-binding protein
VTRISRTVVVVLFVALAFRMAVADGTLRLATTTSTYETGLLDRLLPPFEAKHGAKVHVISVGTGKAMKLGENGDVDIILVHARKAEDKFVKDGFGVNRRDVMYNDFVILGPKSDPARVSGMKNVKLALGKIYKKQHVFVSRGDDSGTHKKEKSLWSKAGLTPAGKWYLQVGQGMSAALRTADEKTGYVLVDRGTYLTHKEKIDLQVLVEGDGDLGNPYGVIPVSPYKHKHVKYELSMQLVAWLTSPECQKMISEFRKNGEQLFHANAAPRSE